MNTLRTLVLLAAGLSVALSTSEGSDTVPTSLDQFRDMILCTLPDSSPIWEFSDYGCYCGKGGSGRPVDELDRCCQVHDKCYDDATQLDQCSSIFDHPYIEIYSYNCDKASKTVTCEWNNNNKCEMFICECDRKAAECFARSPYNPEHKHLPSDRCQSKASEVNPTLVHSHTGHTDL